nr:uncharacterized protein LOC109150203 [Ipomoea trifida]
MTEPTTEVDQSYIPLIEERRSPVREDDESHEIQAEIQSPILPQEPARIYEVASANDAKVIAETTRRVGEEAKVFLVAEDAQAREIDVGVELTHQLAHEEQIEANLIPEEIPTDTLRESILQGKGRVVDDDESTPAERAKANQRLVERVKLVSRFQEGFVDQNHEVSPSPREDVAPRTVDEPNHTPTAQVDPTIEGETNLRLSPSSARGENMDVPLGASHDDFEPYPTNQTPMHSPNPRPMSDTMSIISTLQLMAKENKSHFKTIRQALEINVVKDIVSCLTKTITSALDDAKNGEDKERRGRRDRSPNQGNQGNQRDQGDTSRPPSSGLLALPPPAPFSQGNQPPSKYRGEKSKKSAQKQQLTKTAEGRLGPYVPYEERSGKCYNGENIPPI